MSCDIECIWAKENKFLVNPDGQVWPCCYLGNSGFTEKVNGRYKDPEVLKKGWDDIAHPIIQEYFKHADELNINNKPIEEILTHEWYTKTLPESWKGEKPHRQCKIWCDKNGN